MAHPTRGRRGRHRDRRWGPHRHATWSMRPTSPSWARRHRCVWLYLALAKAIAACCRGDGRAARRLIAPRTTRGRSCGPGRPRLAALALIAAASSAGRDLNRCRFLPFVLGDHHGRSPVSHDTRISARLNSTRSLPPSNCHLGNGRGRARPCPRAAGAGRACSPRKLAGVPVRGAGGRLCAAPVIRRAPPRSCWRCGSPGCGVRPLPGRCPAPSSADTCGSRTPTSKPSPRPRPIHLSPRRTPSPATC